LDITNFLAAGCSYSQFLNAYKVEEKKSYFPYEWFDDSNKLFQTHLPEYKDFYSSLKKANVLDHDGNGRENYQQLQRVWSELGMETMEDFLIYYNNLDVGPFVTAVERLQQFYFDRKIDVFKTAVSLPGIARKMLFECAKNQGVHFSLFDEKNKDLYRIMKKIQLVDHQLYFQDITRQVKQELEKLMVRYVSLLLDWMQMHCIYGRSIKKCQPDTLSEGNSHTLYRLQVRGI
jgi:hypothetical protein